MFGFKNNKAQSTLEYAVVLAVVVGALIAMQIYMKRGIEGRARSSTDDIGEQFDPAKTTSSFTTTRASKTVETVGEKNLGETITHMGEKGDTTGSTPETATRTGTETVDNW